MNVHISSIKWLNPDGSPNLLQFADSLLENYENYSQLRTLKTDKPGDEWVCVTVTLPVAP